MQTERTRSTALAVTLTEARDHLRITAYDDDAWLQCAIASASHEIEERAGLAILTQTVTVTTDCNLGPDIALPVGPVATGGTATLSTLGDDGTLTPVASGFWLEAGRWPVLHLTDTSITGRVVVTYSAGMGTAPQDVRQAICDQVGSMYENRGVQVTGLPLSMSAAALIARRGRVRL